MSRNLGYTKKFIILKKDFSNMDLQNPKGHGKIEIKGIRGNILISLENAEEETYYNVLLIEKNKSYNLGKIYTEISGKGREELVFNIQDLEASGFQIDNLNGILISRDDKLLLGGYMNKEDGSIESYIRNIKPLIKEETIQEKKIEEEIEEEAISQEEPIQVEPNLEELILEELIPEEAIQEQIIPEIPLDIECDSDHKYEDYRADISPGKQGELLGKEDDFEAVFEPLVDLNKEVDAIVQEEKFQETNQAVVDIKEVDYEGNRRSVQKTQTTNYILNILRYFPYIDPFSIKLEGYNWWKIDYEDEAKGFLPYFSYVVGGYQKNKIKGDFITAKRLMTVYSHYLFGLYNENDEVKYYIYAVPGGFFRDEHPHGGMTGFNTWFSSNDYGGYWLLYIDPSTGHIIYPINPMIPTN